MTDDMHAQTPSRADTVREALLDAALTHAPFDGWSEATLRLAARDAGYSEGEVELYCPDGVLDLISTWSRRSDQAARLKIEAHLPNRIRDKVTQAVLIRLDQYQGEQEAAGRARARLLLPDGLDRGAKLIWNTSDMIWRAIGDQSTDGNFYSKRTILSGVYASTFAIWLEDDSEDLARTRAFLDRRIENVMQIEKAKGQWRKLTAGLPDLSAVMGDLRYGFRRSR